MLPAANRMRSSEDFSYTIRNGKRSGNKILVVHVVGGNREAGQQVGFTVSKKVGNSVVRHRVVRRLRHIMRDLLPQLAVQSVVVRALPGAATANSEQLRAAFVREFTRLGVLS